MKKSAERIHIFLTGFMGAGKSRIGRTLAELLNYPFYDSDDIIEQSAGKKIKEIFEVDGEAHFRQIEFKEIKKLCQLKDPAIISLGGGAIMNEKNFDMIRKAGISIYIASSPEAILGRVKHTDKRPLLNVGEGDNFEIRLLERIAELLNARIPTYEKCDIIIQRDGMELEEIVDLIYNKIQSFREKA
jgi:shikimate kinase